MCELAVFPSARNRRKARDLAEFVLSLNAGHGEAQLRYRLRRHLESLVNRGLPLDLAEADTMAYEAAVRATMWRIVMQGQGGAA